MVITNIVEAQVAIGRLTKFLTGSELQTDAVIRSPKAKNIGDTAVLIKNGTFLWSKAKGEQNYKVALSNINLTCKRGNWIVLLVKLVQGNHQLFKPF